MRSTPLPDSAPSTGHLNGRGGNRREALLLAATEAFAARGYEGATVRDIARRAGCTEGMVRHYFANKDGLLEAVLQKRATDVARSFDTLPPQATLEDEIRALFEWQLHSIANAPAAVRLTQGMSYFNARAAAQWQIGHANHIAALTRRLERHQLLGHIRPGVNIELLAEQVSLTAIGIARLQIIDAQPPDAPEWIAQAARGLALGFGQS